MFLWPDIQLIISEYITVIALGMPWLGTIRNILVFLVITFIFISVLFALNLNLYKFILFGVLSVITDIFLKLFPVLVTSGTYFYFFDLTIIFTIILSSSIIFLSFLLIFVTRYNEEARIRREILVLGTKYPDFKLKNVSKNCRADKNTVIVVAKKMIRNKEIYADYFNLSKKFVFNNKANSEEIDKLMEMFSEWETEHIGKKIK